MTAPDDDDVLDLIQKIWTHLRLIPGLAVDDRLPRGDNLDPEQVYCVVDELPGETQRPWGGAVSGDVLARHVIEIDLHGPSRLAMKPFRRQVNDAISQLPGVAGSGVTRVETLSSWHRRPDQNPNLRRVGAEFALTAFSA